MPTNPISTGDIDITPIVLNASDTIYPDDRHGTLAKISSLPVGTSVDNIFFFSIGGEYFRRIIDGPMSASYCGIYPAGDPNVISRIGIAISAGVKTIVFDNPNGGVYSVDSLLTIPPGIVLKFYNGNLLGGEGTINGGIIDAGYNQQIFDITSPTPLIINPEGTTNGGKFSVMWMGAVLNLSSSNTAAVLASTKAIQATIDLVIRNNKTLKTIYFPSGDYLISMPLIAFLWSGTKYTFFTVYFEGESSYWPSTSAYGTRILPQFNDTFALGIQQGKGCKVKGIMFEGKFNPPVTGTGYDFFSCSFENFTDGSSRDNQYSPYSGIVIDPFANTDALLVGQTTADRYPGYTDWYRGDASKNGSTGIELEDIYILNFVVNICSSPNGQTSNEELLLITKYQFKNTKLAISGGQEQEKMNKVQFAAGWGNIHTVFATGYYGRGTPGNWFIEELNLAENVNRLIHNNQTGYFPTYVKKVFAESLGTFGYINSFVAAEVDSCEISFQLPENSKMIQFNIHANGVKFSNCNLRYYQSEILVPISILGNAIFENVTFNTWPFIVPEQLGQQGSVTFINCTANTYKLGIGRTISQITNHPNFVFASAYAPLGNFKTYDPIAYLTSGKKGYVFSGEKYDIGISLGEFSITVSGTDRIFILPLGTANLFRVNLHGIVGASVGGVYYPVGMVTAINYITGDVTISYAAKELVNGTYFFSTTHPILCGTPFLGDVVSGENTITNVKVADGLANAFIGLWIKSPVHVTDNYNPYVRIIDWDNVDTLTVSANAYYSTSAVFFCNDGMQYNTAETANGSITLKPVQKGSEFSIINAYGTNGYKQEYVVSESGYFDPGPAPETRRAYFIPKTIFECVGNPEGTVYFPSGAMARDRITGEIYLKTSTDPADYNGGPGNWVKQRSNLTGSIVSGDSITLPAGAVVSEVVIRSTTTQAALLVGTTIGGAEIGSISFTGSATAGAVLMASILGTGSNSIYFTNVAGVVNYRMILE